MLKIRPVDLSRESEDLLAALKRNLGIAPDPNRLDWLYRKNPSGPAWSWFVYEAESQRIVGSAAVFPRVMWIGGEQQLCGQVGNFSIDADYRSLGPALMLQRATLIPVDEGQLSICYDCPPHDLGMSTFRRLGMRPSCQMHRYARLMKTDRQIEKILRRKAPVISRLGNTFLALRDLRKHGSAGVEVSTHTDLFGDEFSSLDERVGGTSVIRSRRRAEDLNWRYREDPLRSYTVLAARQGGELVGFLIFFTDGTDAQVIDLFALPSANIAMDLIDALIEKMKESRVETVHFLAEENAWFLPALQRMHFRLRGDTIQVVAYARPGSGLQSLLDESPRWAFSHVEYMA